MKAKRTRRAQTNEPSWRAHAVATLFDMFWQDYCEPDNPDHYDGEVTDDAQTKRRQDVWDTVFAPLAAAGVWDIFFPTKEDAGFDEVYELREHFFASSLPLHARRGDWKAAIHEAATIRALREREMATAMAKRSRSG